MNKVVSVIVPVYNCENYLEKCIASILNQTYRAIELIIINDGSRDKSLTIIEEFSKLDQRVRAINQENQGVSISRNKGLALAKGEYVLFVDADDYIEENMIEILVINSEKYNSQITSCEITIERAITERNIIINKTFDTDKMVLNNEELKRVFPKKLSTGIFHSPCAKLYRTDLLKQNNAHFNPNISLGEDFLFNLPLFKNIDKYVYISKPMYHYMIYSNNTLSKKYRADMFEIKLKLFNETISILNSWNIDKKHFEKYIYELLFNDTLSVLMNEASLSNTSTKFKKLKRLRYMVNHKEVRALTSQKSFRPKGYKTQLIFYLLKLKVLPLLLLVGKNSKRKIKNMTCEVSDERNQKKKQNIALWAWRKLEQRM